MERFDERRLGTVMVAPALALMALVVLWPVLQAFWLSLHRYNIKFPDDREWVGLSNYARVLEAGSWWEALVTTIIFTVLSVSIEFVLGLLMALMMHQAIGWKGPLRVSILVPWATITVVTALAWKWLYTPGIGIIATVLEPFIGADSCLLCSRWGAMWGMVFADVWKTAPFIGLLLLAGLQNISADLYEAAEVDGASTWDKFRHITLPMLKPAILVALLFRTLDSFRMFDLAFIMTGGANQTRTVSVLAYDQLINKLNIGVGSAISMLIFLLVFAIAFIFVRVLGANPQAEDR